MVFWHFLASQELLNLCVDPWISAMFILNETGHAPFPMGDWEMS